MLKPEEIIVTREEETATHFGVYTARISKRTWIDLGEEDRMLKHDRPPMLELRDRMWASIYGDLHSDVLDILANVERNTRYGDSNANVVEKLLKLKDKLCMAKPDSLKEAVLLSEATHE